MKRYTIIEKLELIQNIFSVSFIFFAALGYIFMEWYNKEFLGGVFFIISLISLLLGLLLMIIVSVLEKIDAKKKKEQRKSRSKEKSEAKRKSLIKKYGEEDGMMIFNGKISEKKYLREKELIEKYGEKDGTLIFKGKISEKNYIKKKERQNNIKKLCELHGDEFGEAVYNNELRVGMDKPAVTESWGDSGLKKRSKWYYASEKRLNIVYFKSSKVSEIVEDSDLFELDMEKEEVIALWGAPSDEKKTVYKTSTKLRWYYFPRTTRQYTTVYEYHVDLEDDLVVGWKELE